MSMSKSYDQLRGTSNSYYGPMYKEERKMGLYVVGVKGFFKFICIILVSDANSNVLGFHQNSCAFLSMLLFLAKVM
jgi:hypothetical protein